MVNYSEINLFNNKFREGSLGRGAFVFTTLPSLFTIIYLGREDKLNTFFSDEVSEFINK